MRRPLISRTRPITNASKMLDLFYTYQFMFFDAIRHQAATNAAQARLAADRRRERRAFKARQLRRRHTI
ncbi:hypothetical protein H4R33_003755 [Dimargaris cristalligena]|nr:hypothetical protein H4R33_003755 [Dimargaris cristalligena]